MNNLLPENPKSLVSILSVLVLVMLVGYGAGIFGYTHLQNRFEENKKELASTTAAFEANMKVLEEAIIRVNDDLSSNLEESSEQLKKISGTVGTLDKLSKTDKELLQKYSKVYFLNEHYIPSRLTKINSDYVYDKSRTLEFHADVYPFLRNLLEEAEDDDIDLKIASAYRSFGTQTSLKANYKQTYGVGTANTFSADQGYSEHQLGTTVDFTTSKIGGGLAGFDATPAYEWLTKNAHKYGFILSYPKGNAYYVYEPWHWRFVGVELAEELHDEDETFYGTDQRDIDKYLVNIFDK